MQKNYMCTENSDCCYLPIIGIYWKRISIHDVIKQVRSCGYSAMRLKKKKPVESSCTLGGMELLRSGWAMGISSGSSCDWKERWMNVGEHGYQNRADPGCGEP